MLLDIAVTVPESLVGSDHEAELSFMQCLSCGKTFELRARVEKCNNSAVYASLNERDEVVARFRIRKEDLILGE